MKKFYLFMTACVTSVCLCGTIAQTYVTPGGSLQDSIITAESGTTVYVAAGTYVGNYIMKDGVNISGSWNDDFTVQDTALYASVLDGNDAGTVVNFPACEITTTMKGFVIRNGKATNGGGVVLSKNCILDYCLVQNCLADNGAGGGVFDDNSTEPKAIVRNCMLYNNRAKQGAGFKMRGCIEYSVIANNTTTTGAGGGGHSQGGIVRNCVIKNNTSGENAGGLRLYGSCVAVNCLIMNNVSTGQAGGISCESKVSDVVGCTIVGNNVGDGKSGCGIYVKNTLTPAGKFANCIVWGNKKYGISTTDQIYYVSLFNSRFNNAVYNQTTGSGSIALAVDNDDVEGPRFTDPVNGDYTLRDSSVCVNAGLNTCITDYDIIADLNGQNRIIDTTVDIGAYENQTIPEDVPTALIGTMNPAYKVIGEKCAISIMGAQGQTVSIYSIMGTILLKTVAKQEQLIVSAKQGVYIVRVGNQLGKIIVK